MDAQLEKRYSRQIKLPHVLKEGQETLLRSEVLIIGLGGLGSPVSMYLAAAGIGRLVLADHDEVEITNLQRQIVHGDDNIGQPKASSARETLLRLNPHSQVTAFDYELDRHELIAQTEKADVLVDCTDNFPTRFELNRISLQTKTPLVSGAAIRWEGQIATFNPALERSPCYQCLYPDLDLETENCAAEGVIAPIVGIVGSVQALEVLNLLLHTGDGLCGRLLAFDGIAMEWQTVILPKNPACRACSIN